MSCCGGSSSSKRAIRSSSAVASKASKPAKSVAIRHIRQRSATPASAQRQYVVPRQACPKCGRPTMLVYIANRERQQCTNIDCRFIIQ